MSTMPGPGTFPRRAAGRAYRQIAGTVAMLLAVTLSGQVPAAGADRTQRPSAPRDVTGVRVAPVKYQPLPTWTAGDLEIRSTPRVTWPAPGKATVDLTAVTGAENDRSSGNTPHWKAGSLPVWISSRPRPGQDVERGATTTDVVNKVTVEVADRATARKAGVSGLILRINRADGARRTGVVTVQVDYSGFARAYGGDWASRLRLVTLPDGRPLKSVNDTRNSTVSARVPLTAAGTATTVALTSSASGDNGDYSATSLSAASTWQTSQQTGSFSWSYPLKVPPGTGGPQPSLGLSYSSGSLDGRTSGNNTQGSWIGDGWDMWPGYVERHFRPCADDKDAMRGNEPNNKTVTSYDQCWLKPEGNATISLNGRATELVKSTGNTWKGVADDGSRIELLTDTSLGNGDNDGEYWKVTTTDGVQYFFGRNKGPGGTSATVATNSVWTTQVYGNHPDEPGYQAGNYSGSHTTQGWRWNLDYVVDPHGNTMTYFYKKETGAYGAEGDPAKRTTYDRGGYLDQIEYGNRNDAASTTQAAVRLKFEVADRCAANCWSGSDPVPASWPDTPWDQYCKQAPCTDQLAPTYWTQKRLSVIKSQVYSGSGTTYNDVEWLTLRHTYLQAGGNEGTPMWLAGITRTGKVTSAGGAEVSDPEIVINPGADALPGRVMAVGDTRSSLFRYRVATITTETGAQLAVTYSSPECVRTALPAVHANDKPCFPQYYGPPGEAPTLDWFHKYRVTRVDMYDNTGGFAHQQTDYVYLDQPAWHYDDSELVDEKKRTWGEYRGYGKVQVRSGLDSGVRSATDYLYLRGMDGDKQPTGVRDVWVTDSQNVGVEDHEAYAGMLREETTLLGVGGDWVSGTINTPVLQGPTATSGPLKAFMTNVGTVRNRSRLSGGGTRWTKTVTQFNTDNLPTQVDDLGDESTATDDVCARTWYARNPANWMLDKVKKTEKVGVNCATTAAVPGDVLASTRTTYDNVANNWDTYLPVKGDPVKAEEIDSWSGTTPTWVTTSHFTYDTNGRATETYDALDRKTTTSYTPALAGPVTSTVVTNPLGRTVTATLAPAWGAPTTVVDDANNLRTDVTYDGAGRTLKVWLPGRAKATYPTAPNKEFSYLVRSDAPTAVTSRTLLPSVSTAYHTSITLYDGLLRQRQTQTQATGGGRVLNDTVYDSRGLVQWVSKPYYDNTNAPPDTTLVAGAGTAAVPAFVENVYDGAGRVTDSIFKVGSNQTTNEKWRTTTSYDGERTSVTPPAGGTATTTIVDARGRTTTLRQYKNRPDVGSDDPTKFDATSYAYNERNELESVTDPAGSTWRYRYDQRGRRVRDEDPDKGVTTSTYDVAGQVSTTTDARNTVLAYTYDSLGRKTTVREGSTTGPKRAEWVYDTLQYGVGKLTRSIRYEPAGSTSTYVNEVGSYDSAGRPSTTMVTIPAAEGGLCASGTLTPCTYSYTTTYRPNGAVASTVLPAAAGMASETINVNYNDVGAPGLLSGATIYASSVLYDKLGNLTQRLLGMSGKQVNLHYNTDEKTGRLTSATVVPDLLPEIANFTYTYDDAGNVTKIADSPASGATDTQCYRYDHVRRLTEAWTPSAGDCAPAPTVGGLGGPAAYWHSYTYDASGNRKTEVLHGSTNTTRTYTYPAAGGAAGSKPHAVSQVATTGASTRTDSYTYDEIGNTKTRPGGSAGQTLTWDKESRLGSLVDSSGTTNYVYDADGNRLIRRDPTGSTLYLPGGMEVRKPTSGSATSTRYYIHAGTPVAVRSSAGTLDWITGDHHGTAEATLRSTDLGVSRRRTLPFGGDRGSISGTWPTVMDKGFLGGTKDNTELTHLGAREYDPGIGRFVSVDPVQDLTDPQQWNGYAYADNNPATLSDPSGLKAKDPDLDDQFGHPLPGTGSNTPHTSKASTPKPPTLDDFLDTPVPGGLPDEVAGNSYHGSKRFTYRDAFEWGGQNAGNAAHLCYNVLHLSDTACDGFYENIRPHGPGGWKGLVVGVVGSAMVIGVAACALAGPECWVAAAEEEAAFAGTGALVGGSGLGVAKGYRWVVGNQVRNYERAGIAGVCFRSFSGDTRVLMGDGSTKPISEVEEGDTVMAADPETGERGPRRVSDVWVHQDDLVTLSVGGKRVVTTEDHPYWDAAHRQWRRADALGADSRLLTADGHFVPVQGLLRRTTRHIAAYNLTVTGLHTYYVIAGDMAVLVHNCGGNVALGTRAHGLREFADSNGYTHYLDSTAWQADVRAAVNDPSVHLHIQLDGFDGATPADKFMNAYRNGMGDNWYATEWEMYKTGLAVRLGNRTWGSITFYEGGKMVNFPQPAFPTPGG
jgi:RHS repeat-associated protein